MAGQNTGYITTLTTWQQSLAAALDALPGDDRIYRPAQRTIRAMQAALDACAAVPNVKATAADLMSDPRYDAGYKLKQINAALASAETAATSALDELEAAANATRAVVEGLYKPGKPSGVDSATILDRKSDLIALLQSQAGPNLRLEYAAADLLRRALDRADADGALSAYVLAGGPMALWYEAHGANMGMLAEQFAAVVGERTNANGSAATAGASLAPILQGGSGTLQGFCTMARYQVRNDIQAMREYVAAMAANGQLRSAQG